MRGRREDRSYALPAAGAVGFGLPAATLHGLDRILNNAGLDRSKINKETLDAIAKYTDMRPTSMIDPAAFFPEYVERANLASKSRIFGKINPMTVAETLNDSPITRAPEKLLEQNSRLFKILPGGSYLKNLLEGFRDISFTKRYISADKALKKALESGDEAAKASARLNKALASHVLGTSGSYEDAYLRLLDEVTGVSVDRHGHPVFSSLRRKNKDIAEDLYEAVVNHTSPTRDAFKGKGFGSASEYLDALWNNTKLEGSMHAVPGIYRPSTDLAAKIIENTPDKGAALEELANRLGGNKMYSTLRRQLGTAATYGLVDTPSGKLLGALPGTGTKLGKITSKGEAAASGTRDLLTSIFHGDAGRLFSGAAAGHAQDLKKAKIFNILQSVRSPYLRATLALGSLGSAGLLVNNIVKNRRDARKFKWIPDWLKIK